jgi:acylphosphatase
MTNVKVRAHVFVKGRVQGVFFRVETRHEAMKSDVVGWVKNTFDGKVEAVFEGQKEDVEKLVEFCRRGPSGARVTDVDVQWQEYSGEFKDFKIQRSSYN